MGKKIVRAVKPSDVHSDGSYINRPTKISIKKKAPKSKVEKKASIKRVTSKSDIKRVNKMESEIETLETRISKLEKKVKKLKRPIDEQINSLESLHLSFGENQMVLDDKHFILEINSGTITINGVNIKLNSSTNIEINGSVLTEIKGSIIKLN